MEVESEVFSPVPNTNQRYWASSFGYLWDMKLKHKVPLRCTQRGWYDCKVWFGTIRKTINVHRVIAMTFLGESDLTVNHIDGNKAKNAISNLEYMSRQEQNWHRSRVTHSGNQYPIYCVETGDIYPNAHVAAEVLHLKDASHIGRVAKQQYGFKSVYGYHFLKAC